MLPQAVAQTFIRITQQWELTGRTPTVLQRTRQINLIKPGKIKNNTIEAKHLRPISVSSLWWRWWSSAWATSELMRDWRSQTLPGYILGGPGSEGCEQITHNCLQQFQQKGYLCSLDYSFAFDTIDPLTAAHAMGKIGLPEGLWRVLCHQWSNQSRLMQWSTSSSPAWLSTTMSVPQGDPCSPLALNVFMWAGCRYVANQAPAQGEDRAMAVYMDDRTWTASTPQVLLRTLRAWGEFSNRAAEGECRENATVWVRRKALQGLERLRAEQSHGSRRRSGAYCDSSWSFHRRRQTKAHDGQRGATHRGGNIRSAEDCSSTDVCQK